MFKVNNIKKILVGLMFVPCLNIYAKDVYNDFTAISDISNLHALGLMNSEVANTTKHELHTNIIKYVADNLSNLIDNKFREAKKQLMANLPKSKDLLPNAETLKVQKLRSDLLLITIQTYTSAYQASGIFLIYDAKNIKLSLVPFAQNKRYEFENMLDFKIVGDNLIQFTAKSRDKGDCGTITNYQYSEGFFKVVKKREFKCVN